MLTLGVLRLGLNYQILGGGVIVSASAGASTSALLNSLQTETDAYIFNYAQGNSGIAKVVDSGTPANDLDMIELTQETTDITDYTSPSFKHVTGPEATLRYAAHNTWTAYSEGITDWASPVQASTSDVALSSSPSGTSIIDGILLEDDNGGASGVSYMQENSFVFDDYNELIFYATDWNGSGWIRVQYANITAPAPSVYMDLANATVGTTSGFDTATCEDIGNGWRKITLRADVSAKADVTGNVRVYLAEADNDQNIPRDGTYNITFTGFNYGRYPRDTTYLRRTTADRYALPQTHDALVYDTSTTSVSISIGNKTFTTVGSDIFTPGQNIKCWVDDDNWMSGTVVVQSGTSLTVSVDHIKGSGSHTSWHLCRIKGLSRERASTNVCQHSRDYSQWSIAVGAPTATKNLTGPDGETSAYTLEDDAAGGYEGFRITEVISGTSTDWTCSNFIKKDTDETRFPEIQFYLNASGYAYTQVNTKTGEFVNRATAGTVNVRVESFNSDYWIVKQTVLNPSTNTNLQVFIYPAAGTTIGVLATAATGTVGFGGTQVESASEMSSFIYTNGSSVTRLVDDISKATSELPFADGAAGSHVSSFTMRNSGQNPYVISYDDGTATDRHVFYSISGDIYNFSTGGINAPIGDLVNGNDQKVAMSWDTNRGQGALDGVTNTEDTSHTNPSSINIVNFGSDHGQGQNLTGILEYDLYRARDITQANLETETAKNNYSGFKGADTLALTNSLRYEPNVTVFNWKQGVYHVKDTATPANNANTQPITDLVVDNTSPSVKHVTQPDRTLKYAAQNLCTDSEDLSQWSPGDTTVSGTTITADGTGTSTDIFLAHSLETNVRHRAVVRFSAGTEDKATIVVRGDSNENFVAAVYDLATVTVSQTDTGNFGGTIHSTSITAVDGAPGQFDCEMIFTTVASSGRLMFVGMASAATGNTFSASGRIDWGSTPAGTETINVHRVQLSRHPAADEYLATTGTVRYAIPCDHDAATYTTSTSSISAAYGAATITTADSATFSAGDHIRISDQSAPHTNYLTGTVTSHSGTTLVINVDHYYGTLSGVSSWHCIKILGVLVEPAATNVVEHSKDPTQWVTVANSTITGEQATGPSGETDMARLDDAGGGGTGSAYVYNSVSVANSTQYCWSMVAKADQLNWVTMTATAFTTPGTADVFFNLSNGTIGTVDAGIDAQGIEDLGGGLYRCWIVFTTDAVDTTGQLRMYLADGDNDRIVSLDGTSSVFVGYSQLEIGSKPSSFIHTPSTSSVTRLADDLSKDGAELNLGTGEITLVSQARARDVSMTNYILELYEDANDRSLLYYNGSNPRFFVQDGGVTSCDIDAGTLTDDTEFKLAGRASDSDFAASVDGATAVTDASGTADISYALVQFGGREGSTGSEVDGHLGFSKITPRGVPNTDLQLETD